MTSSRLVLIVVIIVALEIAEFAHHFRKSTVIVLRARFRRIVLVGSCGLRIDFTRIGSALLGLEGSGKFQKISTVAEHVRRDRSNGRGGCG